MNWYFTLQYTVKPPECYSYYFSDVTTESLHIRETKVSLLRPTHWMGPGESADKRHPSLRAGWVRGAQAMPILWMWRPTGAWCCSSPVPTPGFPSNQGLKKAHFFFPSAPQKEQGDGEDHNQPLNRHRFTFKPGLSVEQHASL